MDRADRSAATVRKASRIACRMASSCANVNDFLPGRCIGEGQVIRENLDLGRPDRVRLLFPLRLTRATPPPMFGYRTRIITDGVQPREYSRARRSTWTARKHRYEQKFRERIGSGKHLPRLVVLHLHCLSFDTGEHQFEALLTRRKATRRREPVVATHRCRFQMRRDREGDGWRFRLANHEPAFGFGVFKHDVAPGVPRKRVSEGLDVTRDRRTEFLDQSPTVNADEVSLSSGCLLLAGTHCVPLSLVIHEPLNPVSDHHASAH